MTRVGEISPIAGSAGPPAGIPMSITVDLAGVRPCPGAIHSPGLAAWKVTVASARTATPWTSPVEASTPLGTSHATTTVRPSAAAALIAAIAAARRARAARR